MAEIRPVGGALGRSIELNRVLRNTYLLWETPRSARWSRTRRSPRAYWAFPDPDRILFAFIGNGSPTARGAVAVFAFTGSWATPRPGAVHT